MIKGAGRGVVVGRASMDGPEPVGIDEEVGKQLETGGVDTFAASYLKVLDIIEASGVGRRIHEDRTQLRQGWVRDMAFPGCDLRRGRRAGRLASRAGPGASRCGVLLEGVARGPRPDQLDARALHPRRCTSGSWRASRVWPAPARPSSTSASPSWRPGPSGTPPRSRSRSSGSSRKAEFVAFPDALRFILAVKAAGIEVAAASSSRTPSCS